MANKFQANKGHNYPNLEHIHRMMGLDHKHPLEWLHYLPRMLMVVAEYLLA